MRAGDTFGIIALTYLSLKRSCRNVKDHGSRESLLQAVGVIGALLITEAVVGIKEVAIVDGVVATGRIHTLLAQQLHQIRNRNQKEGLRLQLLKRLLLVKWITN